RLPWFLYPPGAAVLRRPGSPRRGARLLASAVRGGAAGRWRASGVAHVGVHAVDTPLLARTGRGGLVRGAERGGGPRRRAIKVTLRWLPWSAPERLPFA